MNGWEYKKWIYWEAKGHEERPYGIFVTIFKGLIHEVCLSHIVFKESWNSK